MIFLFPSPSSPFVGSNFILSSFGWTQCRESRKYHQAKLSTHQWQVANWWSATPHGCSFFHAWSFPSYFWL